MTYYAFSALLNFLTGFALGAFTLMNGLDSPLKKKYFYFTFCICFWSFGYFFWQIADNAGAAYFWSKVLMGGAILAPAVTFDFSLQLTDNYIQKRKELFLAYALTLFFLIVNFATPFIVAGNEPRMIFKYWPIPGILFAPFLFMFFFYVAYSIYILLSSYPKSSPAIKDQIKYVAFAYFIAFFGGSTNYFLWFNIPILPILNFLVAIHVAIIGYAITKHHLMDISVVISRAVAEILTILFQGGIYLGLSWLYLTYGSGRIDWPFLTWTIIYGILVGQTYQGTRLFIQTTADKVFIRGRYDYYKSLSDASSHVGEKLSLPDILKVLYDTFHEVVEISNPRVFLPEYFTEMEKTSNRYLVYDKKTFLPDTAGGEVRINNPLIKELISKREPLQDVKELDAALLVPCLLEDRLIGFFALGRKLSEDPYTDEDMRLLKILANQAAITLDHTRSYEKIKADLEIMERQLERSQRLASLGTLTAGVTHEIRNPLTVIRIETERLAMEARDLEYLKQHRDLLLKHIDRISGIVNRMLGLAKDKPKQQTVLNINELLESTLQLFPISKITVKRNLLAVPEIKGDAEALQEAFVNLIQNAIDAMPEGGTLTLRTYLEDNRVAVEIQDTGKGIPEEIREKIFDPFYSTRHEGVGLGLSIAYRIIREHGGDIRVTSEVGKGSIFKILF